MDYANKGKMLMIELRDYQKESVDLARLSLAGGKKRPLIVLPTGAGKSVVFGEIVSLACEKDKVCLFLVHRRNLVVQFKQTLEDLFGIQAGVIMAGTAFLTGMKVYVSTIQTYSRRLQLDDGRLNKFYIEADVILCDEAHTTVSKTYQDVFNHYPESVIIGTTATPMRADQRGLGEVYDDLIDVADAARLTDGGYLAPIKYFVPTILDLSRVGIRLGDYEKKGLAEEVDKPRLVGDIVENWLKLAEGRKTIIFAINVKHSIHIRDEFRRAGIAAEHVDARTPDHEREEVFRQMDHDNVTVLCNVAVYQEGMDCPDISCVVMARPTKSLGLCRQCIGRGMRISDSFPDLVVLDHGGVIEEHGFVTDEVEWTLDGRKIAWKKKAKVEKIAKVVQCRACDLVFEGTNKCPDCGTEVKTFGKKIEVVEGDLQEAGAKKRKPTMEEKRIWYGMALWYVREQGWKAGAAAHKYKERFGVWPNKFKGMACIKPDINFMNYQKHLMIKWAKGKQKERNEA